MLELKNINKSYKTGNFIQHALKDVSINFRKNEFVAILGASGSGKTTLLNIIGGLDRYDSGDLIINNKSTKKFKSLDWDRYRNNCIGFIFQSYNLIPHISILDNVEMGMTLSGVNSKTRRRKAKEALKKVGLLEHIHKKPNQLSGGQMQRVAIARALVNDPDIILADEPTGALDTKTSIQIMELIKEIAKNKLVIMVTHNPDLAKEYATRIIEFQDGVKLSDSNPIKDTEKDNKTLKIRKTAMSFLTALKLSFNNIKTKKGRTLITAFASSIGIIGIGLILSLSNGFKIEVDKFEKNSLSQAPIIISTQAMSANSEDFEELTSKKLDKYPESKEVHVQKDIIKTMYHTNKITDNYISYLEKIDSKYLAGVSYSKGTNLIVVNKDSNNKYNLVSTLNSGVQEWTLLPTNPNNDKNGVIDNMYDVIAGEINNNEPGLILQVDSKNQVYESVLEALGIENKETVTFDEIMNKELKVILNNDYYIKSGNMFYPSQDLEKLYNNKNSITIKVQAIIRGKEDQEMLTNGSGLAYTSTLTQKVIEANKNSDIVKAQEKIDYNILTNSPFDETSTKEYMLGYLGSDVAPIAIYLYPQDFNSKEEITNYLDKYNEDKKSDDKIEYTDMASMISSLSGGIMDAITVVLIAFSSISLIVSSIMIAIITYISVLERTKEIGILRALGARKKDIKRVFNAETFIIGLTSGLLGIIIAYLLTIPTNHIIENLSGLAGVAKLNIIHAIILVIINVILTMIGGTIPARMASKKNPVEALRTE
ncbi:MAG: ATP-binding cassette domain-containing protein [Tenericutes bacterium]|nr:ATP-binding cassette domain-containing protein [Mycoplasmatota bacterium]